MPTNPSCRTRPARLWRAAGARHGALLLVAVLSAACADAPGTALAPGGGSPTNVPRGAYLCTVALPSGTVGTPVVSCYGAGSAPGVPSAWRSRDVTLGSQNVNTRLTLSAFAYSSNTNIFSLNCTVTNLLTQPIGTTDGSTTSPNGVQVFFSYGPFANAGSGAVAVANPDGTGTFDGVTVPYFKYTPFIKPNATSAAKTWRFNVPSTVTGFTFRVEVNAAVPAQNSVLRWVTLRQGVTGNQLNAAWQNTASDIWAVGLSSTILHYDGTQWSAPTTGLPAASYTGVWGTSGSDVWAVGNAGTAVHYDGSSWTAANTGVQQNWTGVWGDVASDYYAAASSGKAFHYDGTAWSAITFPFRMTSNLRAVWGSDASHVLMVGDGGTILFYNGTTWSQSTVATGGLYAVWGTASNNVYAVGRRGTVAQYNGSTWASSVVMPPTGSAGFNGIYGASATDIYAVGNAGLIEHSDGTTWSFVANTGTGNLNAVSGGGSPATYFAVASDGTAYSSSDGGSWSALTFTPANAKALTAVSGASSANVWTTGNTGTAYVHVGSGFVHPSSANATTTNYKGVRTTGSSDVYLVGPAGAVEYFNGAEWLAMPTPVATTLRAIFGTAAQNVYVVGDNGVVLLGTGT